MPSLLRLAALVVLVVLACLPLPGHPANSQSPPGELIYESKCLLCHPNSPGDTDHPRYKARPDAVPLWTLWDPEEGWKRSQIGLGQLTDNKIKRFLHFPKGMKPDTRMISIPLTPEQRERIVDYIKYLGKRYGH